MFKIALKELDMMLKSNHKALLVTSNENEVLKILDIYNGILDNQIIKSNIIILKRINFGLVRQIANYYKVNDTIVQDFLNMYRYRRIIPHIVRDTKTKTIICHTSLSCLAVNEDLISKYDIMVFPYIHSYLFQDYMYNIGSKIIDRPLFKIEEKIFNNSIKIITNTKRIKLYLIKKGFEARKIKVLYPSAKSLGYIDSEDRLKWIVAATRWDTDRKINFYLELANRLKKERLNYKIVLVGNWPNHALLSKFIKNIKKRDLKNYIIIFGNVAERKLYEILKRSSIYIFAENAVFGMGALEAGAQGTPIIVSEYSGIWEIFKHGVHGYRARYGDVDDFLHGIFNVDKNWKLYSYNIYLEAKKYSWTVHFKKLIKIIETL